MISCLLGGVEIWGHLNDWSPLATKSGAKQRQLRMRQKAIGVLNTPPLKFARDQVDVRSSVPEAAQLGVCDVPKPFPRSVLRGRMAPCQAGFLGVVPQGLEFYGDFFQGFWQIDSKKIRQTPANLSPGFS